MVHNVAWRRLALCFLLFFFVFFCFGCRGESTTDDYAPLSQSPDEQLTAHMQMLEDNLLTLSTCIFDATNHEREKVGLPSLSWDEELARIARAHSAEMASQKQLFHVSPDGKGPLDRYREAGYGLCSLSPEMGAIYLCGENVAKVFVVRATLVEPYVGKIWEHDLKGIEEIAAEAMFAWLRSPEHKEAILSPGFTRLGVGVFLEKEEGAVYITQNFS